MNPARANSPFFAQPFSVNMGCTPPLMPSITPTPGTYRTDLQQVGFAASQPFLGFWYTLDGSDPRTNGILWDEQPFTITQQGPMQIKVAAQGYNLLFSEVFTGDYVWIFPDALPATITPNSGTYTAPLPVNMVSPQGLEIRYTTDGSTPTETSPLFTGVFNLTPGTYTVKNRVFGDQFNPSPVTEVNYQVNAVSVLAMVSNNLAAYYSNDENLVNWVQITLPPTPAFGSINGVASSRAPGVFGKYMYVATGTSGGATDALFRSDNFGATFTRIQTQTGVYGNVVCDETGQYVYCWTTASGTRRFAYSSDYGNTFSTIVFSSEILRVTCSPNGRYVYISLNLFARNIWVSADFGATFTQLTSVHSFEVAASQDGSTYFTSQSANPNFGLFNKWTNFGANRAQFQIDANPVNYVYSRIDTTPDNQTLIIARGIEANLPPGNGRVFINNTGGNQTGWTQVAPTGTPSDQPWTDVATNGTRYLACTNVRIYASLNGTSWFETQPAGNVNRAWNTCIIYRA